MSVLCLFRRMFENKINELEKELARKTSSVSELKQRLKETSQREEEAQISIRQLQDQVMAADKWSCMWARAQGVAFLHLNVPSVLLVALPVPPRRTHTSQCCGGDPSALWGSEGSWECLRRCPLHRFTGWKDSPHLPRQKEDRLKTSRPRGGKSCSRF